MRKRRHRQDPIKIRSKRQFRRDSGHLSRRLKMATKAKSGANCPNWIEIPLKRHSGGVLGRLTRRLKMPIKAKSRANDPGGWKGSPRPNLQQMAQTGPKFCRKSHPEVIHNSRLSILRRVDGIAPNLKILTALDNQFCGEWTE